MDLRDKLSGLATQTHQATQIHEGPKVQRRVASVVFNGSNITQGVTSTTAPVSARSTATVKRSSNVMVLTALLYISILQMQFSSSYD